MCVVFIFRFDPVFGIIEYRVVQKNEAVRKVFCILSPSVPPKNKGLMGQPLKKYSFGGLRRQKNIFSGNKCRQLTC